MKLFIISVLNISWKLNINPWSACITVADYLIGSLARHHSGPNHDGSHFEFWFQIIMAAINQIKFSCTHVLWLLFSVTSSISLLPFCSSLRKIKHVKTSDIKCWSIHPASVRSWQTYTGVHLLWYPMLVYSGGLFFVIAAPKYISFICQGAPPSL